MCNNINNDSDKIEDDFIDITVGPEDFDGKVTTPFGYGHISESDWIEVEK